MSTSQFTLVVGIAITLLLFYVCYTDARRRIISNKVVLLLLVLVPVFSYQYFGEAFVAPAFVTLVIGFFLSVCRVIGAGDVKLLSVLMLMVPPIQVMGLLFVISVFGLIEIIIGLLFFRHYFKKLGVPYGIAISLGFISHFLLMNMV